MLLRQDILDGIAAGRVTLAFRRWQRPTVRAGGTLRTAIGVVGIDAVDVVDESGISEADATRSGFASRAALLADLRRAGTLYRITLHLAGEDPRIALRAAVADDPAARQAILDRLAAIDARAADGAWTARTLQLIAVHPGVWAGKLAVLAGTDIVRFKRRVRQLKELGLTESLPTGYRLSPRGASVLRERSGS